MIHVPKRMRFSLDSEKMNTLFQKRCARFKRSLLKSIISYTGYQNALKIVIVEYKKFERSENTIEEIRCCDRVIGTIYLSRTEFNHQEALFSAFPDAFKYIKKSVKELKTP